ncbi:hypothetical protein [Terricaulis silvestris]|uniref:Uncharacterized protein n=1 Tax=Terricaulis silvestris TaxID=2686094 RepID=A0A6I6MMA4_9CAUL|nr:hypothetical protein [Terricaulis silvestris]QGZ95161.1 hypothetical protein DSM104635_02005 [Terricaulis silvestris]
MKRIVTAPKPEEAPRPQWEEYEALARRALEFFATYQEEFRDVLTAQVRALTFGSMEYSGWGFFLSFELPTDVPVLQASGPISGRAYPPDKPDDVLRDIGIVLFIKDGRVDLLEAHGLLEWPEDITGYMPAKERG